MRGRGPRDGPRPALDAEQQAAYERSRTRPAVPPLRPITYAENRAGHEGVVVTSVRLTWGDAFDIFGKFAAVFIFWQLIAETSVYVLIRVAS